MHDWKDKDVDWNGIDAAAHYIGAGLRRWGRVDVQQYKEKFGTVRVYCSLGLLWWPQITHPGSIYTPWPRWLDFISFPISRWNPFGAARRFANLGVLPFHKWLYRRYYRRAVARWPHLRREILCAADYSYLLRGL